MNRLKTLFSSVLLLLVVCQASPAHAKSVEQTRLPIYRNTIANISLGYDEAMLTGTVKLDNGLTLRIVDYKTRDDNVMKTWSEGDALAFKAQVQDEALVLTARRLEHKNEDLEAVMIVDVTKEPNSSLKIVQINDGGKFVKLSDGSVWEFSWLNQFSTKKWHENESVLVNGTLENKLIDGKVNCYEFINIDLPVQDNAHTAKASFVID